MNAEAGARTRASFAIPKRIAGLWLIGVALYLAAITYIGWGDVAETVRSLRFEWIAAGMLIETCAIWLRAWKWSLALGGQTHAYAQFFLSKAAGNLTPGRLGELSPLLLKRFRHPKTGAWIVLDRLMEASATLLFGFAGAVFVAGVSDQRMLLVWIPLVAVVVGGLLYALFRGGFPHRLRGFVRPEARHGGIRAVASFVCDAADEVRELGPKSPALGTITIGVTAMDIFVAICLYASFGERIPFLTLGAAQCAHAIVSAIPISPNVTGIPYAVSAGILHEVAGVAPGVLVAAIAVRFLMASFVFWISFAIGTGNLFRSPRFANQSELFDHLASGDVLYDYPQRALETIHDAIGSAGVTLDVGCGDGVLGAAIDGDVFGVELSRKCARAARERGIHGVVADAARALPFAANWFDTVACIDVLHHLGGDWPPLLAELGRVLKANGRLVLIEPDARNAFVRWTQAPESPIRVAPWPNEPAIYPADLEAPLRAMGYSVECRPVLIEGAQTVRDVFPLWQRVLKAPFVMVLAWIHRGRPNKFVLIARKPE